MGATAFCTEPPPEVRNPLRIYFGTALARALAYNLGPVPTSARRGPRGRRAMPQHMVRFEDDDEDGRPVRPRRKRGPRAQTGDVEMIRPSQQQLGPAGRQAGADLGSGRIASKGTARVLLERERMRRERAFKEHQEQIRLMSKPRTKEQKAKRAKEAKKEERSIFNPIRCIIYFCTNPVARFWLVCNICFVFGLSAFSVVYLIVIFPFMRGLFNY